MSAGEPSMVRVRQALERSWDADTAYERASLSEAPARGQCYPTARVLQTLFPALEIVEGVVWTGEAEEKHFWNVLAVDRVQYHLDLTWQQFPPGSEVREWWLRDRENLGDSPSTVARVNRLSARVMALLEQA